MKKLLLLVAVLMTTGFVSHAKAAEGGGLFVEPGVTYERGTGSIDYPSPFSNSSGTLQGFGLVARVGFHISDVIFITADGRYGRPQFKDSTNNLDAPAETWQLGPTVGIQTPVIGLRVWGGYIAAGESNPQASNGFDYKFKSGTGYKAGVGFRVTAISLNLEYQDVKYGSTDVEQLGPYPSGQNFDSIRYEDKAWIASVTFPIEL